MDGGLAATLAAIKGRLDGLDIALLLRNPYFVGGSAIFCILALARRMIKTVVFFLAAIGVAMLFRYTVPGRTMTIQGDNLLIFAGGGLAICGAIIYFVFIRSE
jgi:hypothetical protein